MEAPTLPPLQRKARLIMEGRAVVAAKTKRLIGRDLRGCIAVLDHENLDAAAAEALLRMIREPGTRAEGIVFEPVLVERLSVKPPNRKE